jgi:hypothetical protein
MSRSPGRAFINPRIAEEMRSPVLGEVALSFGGHDHAALAVGVE